MDTQELDFEATEVKKIHAAPISLTDSEPGHDLGMGQPPPTTSVSIPGGGSILIDKEQNRIVGWEGPLKPNGYPSTVDQETSMLVSSFTSTEGEDEMFDTAFSPNDPMFTLTRSFAFRNPWNLPTDEEGRKRLVVLGSGDFGLALTARLVQANYNVVVASRDPNRTRERVEQAGGLPMDQTNALQQSNLVIVAIPFQHCSSLPLPSLRNKILIDVSNRNPKEKSEEGTRSQAEHLQTLVPTAKVVKTFNVLSAYTLSTGYRGSKKVPVCSDDEMARQLVCGIVRDMGLDAVDQGRLHSAREVEMIPLSFFKEWAVAFTISVILWLLFFFIITFERNICPNIHNGKPFNWSTFDDIAMSNVSNACGSVALTLLALCYLPGVFAAYLQLWRGTKYSEFPRWLDTWLKCRKQLGLLVMLNVTVHVLNVYAISHNLQGWLGPTFHACGVLSFWMLGILSITSLPSVSQSMTWCEFAFIQSKLGWCSLILAAGHIIFFEWDKLIKPDFSCYLPPLGQIVIFIPVVTIVLKIPLLVPCLDHHLTRIRQGYESVSFPNTGV